jgi:hypothetical protein
MTRTSFTRVALVLTALMPLAVPATAAADPAPTRVAISQTAYYASTGVVVLEVSLSCSPGMGYFVNAQVIQPQGFTQTFGSGSINGQCTGQHQKLALPVFANFFPGWQLGEAVASVTACAQACDSATRDIRITLG